jgi:hypothetical protein
MLDPGHFDPALHTVDEDRFRIAVVTERPLLVQILGAPDAVLLNDLSVRLFDTAVNPRLVAEGHYDPRDPRLGDHGAFLASVAPGDYDVVVSARADSAIAGGSIAYRIRLSPAPACDEPDSPDDYHESHDGSGNTSNDMVDVAYGQDPQFTATAADDDAPEPTGFTFGAGDHHSLIGVSDVTAHADDYLDRDTFELATGDTTNELQVRVDWGLEQADLDFIVFEAATLTPIAISNVASTSQHELAMFAVRPATKYWLWIGNFMGSQATAYRAAACASHFFE